MAKEMVKRRGEVTGVLFLASDRGGRRHGVSLMLLFFFLILKKNKKRKLLASLIPYKTHSKIG